MDAMTRAASRRRAAAALRPRSAAPSAALLKRSTVALGLAAIVMLMLFAGAANAVPPPVLQTPLNGGSLPQFVDPLPTLGDMGVIPAGVAPIQLNMREFQTKMLPTGFVPANGLPYGGTYVWGYLPGAQTTRTTHLGPVIIATRNLATTVQYVNLLGTVDSTNVLAYKNSVDQTLHWADPLGGGTNMANMGIVPMMPPMPPYDQVYTGPIPAAAHLHGGEVPPEVDGGPDSWFLSQEPTDAEKAANPSWQMHGSGYYTDPADATTPVNGATYTYPNTQEAAPIWFHDHTLGATRLNVYAGLAGAYLVTDPTLPLPAGLSATGLVRTPAQPAEDTIVPIVIQDRMFDTNGQLYFPNIGLNPEHPYWVPEFLGDTIVVNGKAWPFMNVKPQRYRFLFLNGSNARTYDMSFKVQGKGTAPVIWQIGADGGYFDKPVALPSLLMMSGQRADVIVDFSGAAGAKLILDNTAKAPYPGGAPVNGQTTGRIMQFRVAAAAVPAVVDDSFNPAQPGATIKGGADATVRLTNPVTGTLAAGVNVAKKRALTLNEVMGMRMKVGGIQYTGGPLEILLNNTKWSATTSETPLEGTTEVWEFVNLTADAHPMHLHLVQFQLINRQAFDVKKYTAAYAAAFPAVPPALLGGVYVPGIGPPLPYNTVNTDGAVGGNPVVSPFLLGATTPPSVGEAEWKDTIMAPPGMVTRIAVRWAPTDKPIASTTLWYPFNPGGHGLYEYVWHCHIVDHEDNEMMRRDDVVPNGPTPDNRP